MGRSTSLFVFAWFALLGCAVEPSLSVQVVTDLVPDREFVRVEITLPGTSTVRTVNADATVDYLSGVELARFTDDVDGAERVRVRLISEDGGFVLEREVRFEPVSARFGVVVVLQRSCVGVECGDLGATQCLNGVCVPADCSPDNLAACGSAGCEGDDSCGVAGPSCVVASCRRGACVSAPSDTRCDGGRCDPAEGCVALGGVDAGTDAADAADASDAEPGCIAGEVMSCERCGTRTCSEDGAFGPCDAMGECEPGQSIRCGATGTQVCGDTCAFAACEEGVHVITDVALGRSHLCLLRAGQVRCAGRTTPGVLGVPGFVYEGGAIADVPVVDLGEEAVAIEAGSLATCALLESGAVRCWGVAGDGILGRPGAPRLGDDETPASVPPVDIRGTAVQLAMGTGHACVLLASGDVTCWGDNGLGQLGLGSNEDIGDDETFGGHTEVAREGETVIGIAAGGSQTCALLRRTDGSVGVRCFGFVFRRADRTAVIFGIDELARDGVDIDVGEEVVSALSIGNDHVVALTRSGSLLSWGSDVFGQLGDGGSTGVGRLEALPVPIDGDVSSAGGGLGHTCALARGEVRCWGGFPTGLSVTGAGSVTPVTSVLPRDRDRVRLRGSAERLFVGFASACALLEGGHLECWGDNQSRSLSETEDDEVGDDDRDFPLSPHRYLSVGERCDAGGCTGSCVDEVCQPEAD